MMILLLLILVVVQVQAVQVQYYSGWLVDKWCWYDNNKVALDTGISLAVDPTAHTVHCLYEVGFCRKSGFMIGKNK